MVPPARHTAALAVATVKVTALPDAPPVALTVKVPFGANTGFVGVATKLVIDCGAAPMATLCCTCAEAL